MAVATYYLRFIMFQFLFANYVGSFKTDYDQNERNCELTIEQSFTTIKVKFKTGESSSHSITASIINDNGTQN